MKKLTVLALIKTILFRVVLVFTLLFIFTFPFPHTIFPNVGNLLNIPFEDLSSWFGDNVLQINYEYTKKFESDSTGLYIHVLLLVFVSFLLSFTSLLLKKSKSINTKIKSNYYLIISYYLASALLIYGFDKIFKHQFYLPEPNLLYTPFGELSKDIAFWSTMGVSRSYSMFSGIVEVIPALFLFFNRTRLLGAILAVFVMTNVIMINFGYDISVKIFSSFLFLLAAILVLSQRMMLVNVFFLEKSTIQNNSVITGNSSLGAKIIKGLLIIWLLADSLYPYFKTNNFNDDLAERPLFHGAYHVESFSVNDSSQTNKMAWKKVFVHRQGYFIIQLTNDKMIDYKMQLNGSLLRLIDYDKKVIELNFNQKDNLLSKIYGKIGENIIEVNVKPINWKENPLIMPYFHWTID